MLEKKFKINQLLLLIWLILSALIDVYVFTSREFFVIYLIFLIILIIAINKKLYLGNSFHFSLITSYFLFYFLIKLYYNFILNFIFKSFFNISAYFIIITISSIQNSYSTKKSFIYLLFFLICFTLISIYIDSDLIPIDLILLLAPIIFIGSKLFLLVVSIDIFLIFFLLENLNKTLMLSVFIGSISIYFHKFNSKKNATLYLILIFLTTLTISYVTKAFDISRTESLVSGRGDIWNLYISSFLDSPFIGYEDGYITKFYMDSDIVRSLQSHSFLLEFLINKGGLIGSLLFFGALYNLNFGFNSKIKKYIYYSSAIYLSLSTDNQLLATFLIPNLFIFSLVPDKE